MNLTSIRKGQHIVIRDGLNTPITIALVEGNRQGRIVAKGDNGVSYALAPTTGRVTFPQSEARDMFFGEKPSKETLEQVIAHQQMVREVRASFAC